MVVQSEKAVKGQVARGKEGTHGRANRVASLTTDGAQVLRLEMQPKRWRSDALAVAGHERAMFRGEVEHGGGLYGGGAAKTADRTLMQGSPRGEPRTAKEHTRCALDVTKYIQGLLAWSSSYSTIRKKRTCKFSYDWRSHTLSSPAYAQAKTKNSIIIPWGFREEIIIIIIIIYFILLLFYFYYYLARSCGDAGEPLYVCRKTPRTWSKFIHGQVGKRAERRIYKLQT